MMNFNQALAQYVLGHLYYEDLPQIALQALQEGYNSPSLLILAGLDGKENTFVIEQYFYKALTELTLCLPSKKGALLVESVYHARGVVEGEMDFSIGIAEMDSLVFHYSYRWKKVEQPAVAIQEKEQMIETHIADLIKILSLYQSYLASDALTTDTSSDLDEIREVKDFIQIQKAVKEQLKLWLRVVTSSETLS